MKTCSKCHIEKIDDCFDKGRNQCRDCRSLAVKKWKENNIDSNKATDKEYRSQNKDSIAEYKKEWYQNNKEVISNNGKQYYQEHKKDIKDRVKDWTINNVDYVAAWQKQYRKENADQIHVQKMKYQKERRKNDINFKLRDNVSALVRMTIFRNGEKKNKKSILNYLPYTIDQLKIHLENQFEPWMNWHNHGEYRTKSWNDNDPTTWKWQIDHIIPQSILSYSSMGDDNFKKCWSLNNLRPLSAKQNILEGSNRIRHNINWGGSNF